MFYGDVHSISLPKTNKLQICVNVLFSPRRSVFFAFDEAHWFCTFEVDRDVRLTAWKCVQMMVMRN
jgi:hypothetical protein